MVSNLKKVIPQSMQDSFHEWRSAMKKTEHDVTGGEHVSDAVEMAGWGVEEAEKNHKAEASMLFLMLYPSILMQKWNTLPSPAYPV